MNTSTQVSFAWPGPTDPSPPSRLLHTAPAAAGRPCRSQSWPLGPCSPACLSWNSFPSPVGCLRVFSFPRLAPEHLKNEGSPAIGCRWYFWSLEVDLFPKFSLINWLSSTIQEWAFCFCSQQLKAMESLCQSFGLRNVLIHYVFAFIIWRVSKVSPGSGFHRLTKWTFMTKQSHPIHM